MENTDPPESEALSKAKSSVDATAQKVDVDPEKEAILKERNRLATREKEVRLDALIEANKDQQADRELRQASSTLVFNYLAIYSAAVYVILLLAGFKICGFHLEGSVLEFLVGSTAASAIGLVAAVVGGLFIPSRRKDRAK